MNEEELIKKAEKRAQDKVDFYQHLGIYIVVNLFILFINLATDRNGLWFYWATFGWGIGLFFHWYSVFIGNRLFSGYFEKEKQKELERLKSQNK